MCLLLVVYCYLGYYVGNDMYNNVIEEIMLGTVDVLPLNELQNKLNKKKQLVVKLGFDPTAPDLHFGHVVILNKLRLLQELGHSIIFIVGDFTALIGDPSGKNITRPTLEQNDIDFNVRSYETQVYKILDNKKTTIRYNSSWLSNLGAEGVIKLASRYNLARMLERDDFKKRFANNIPIALHEMLYPLLQAYDSVAINADIELGGTDQTFNLLLGRTLQKSFNQDGQVIMTLPLLEGLDGVNKMSKSLNNYIAITDEPNDMFGKIMSISDDLMWNYYKLLSVKNIREINYLKDKIVAGENPKNIKILLALELVERFHGKESALKAADNFEAVFKHKHNPDYIQAIDIIIDNNILLTSLLKNTNMLNSTSQAHRLIEQRGIKVDSTTVTDKKLLLNKGTYLIQIGKHSFIKVNLL